MTRLRLFWGGLATFVLASLCCVTPVLIVALGFLGLSAWAAWLDFVLLPLMGIGLAATIVGAWGLLRHRRACRKADAPADSLAEP